MPTPAADASSKSSYNYYPQTMIQLCAISYDDIDSIPDEVEQLGLNVMWGPAQLLSPLGIAYSLAFVVHRDDPNEYTLVIRGTALDSLEAWVTEDFELDTTVPFTQFVPDAPVDASISKGTANGLNDLLSLVDPNTGVSLVSYLQEAQPTYLYVTGHSLGGTLTPPIFAYLNSVLYGGGFVQNMALWTFAGLTPGNADFNTYFNGLFNPQFPWRLYNTLDIAPLCWWNQSGIESIYSPNLSYGEPEKAVFDLLFDLASGNGYLQPADGGTPLTGSFQNETGLFEWVDEAIHQHHVSTYQTLVAQAYPLSYSSAHTDAS